MLLKLIFLLIFIKIIENIFKNSCPFKWSNGIMVKGIIKIIVSLSLLLSIEVKFAQQPYCMAGTMKKEHFSHRKNNLLFLPCKTSIAYRYVIFVD